jgi:hypothetical protein
MCARNHATMEEPTIDSPRQPAKQPESLAWQWMMGCGLIV